MLWYRLSVAVLVVIYFCTGGSMIQTVAVWVLVFWDTVVHTLGGWVGVYWGTVVHILWGRSSTEVLWYRLSVSGWVLVHWGKGVTVVQTLWLSTSVLERWCYCGTDFVVEYLCTGAVVLLWYRLCGWVLVYWSRSVTVVQTLWLSTSVLEPWCYCVTDFVAVWVVMGLWYRLRQSTLFCTE